MGVKPLFFTNFKLKVCQTKIWKIWWQDEKIPFHLQTFQHSHMELFAPVIRRGKRE